MTAQASNSPSNQSANSNHNNTNAVAVFRIEDESKGKNNSVYGSSANGRPQRPNRNHKLGSDVCSYFSSSSYSYSAFAFFRCFSATLAVPLSMSESMLRQTESVDWFLFLVRASFCFQEDEQDDTDGLTVTSRNVCNLNTGIAQSERCESETERMTWRKQMWRVNSGEMKVCIESSLETFVVVLGILLGSSYRTRSTFSTTHFGHPNQWRIGCLRQAAFRRNAPKLDQMMRQASELDSNQIQ